VIACRPHIELLRYRVRTGGHPRTTPARQEPWYRDTVATPGREVDGPPDGTGLSGPTGWQGRGV